LDFLFDFVVDVKFVALARKKKKLKKEKVFFWRQEISGSEVKHHELPYCVPWEAFASPWNADDQGHRPPC
jgi:hypothetical protein